MENDKKTSQKRKSERKHSIDIRGIIPLFFRRYYFVILVGRDTRQETKKIEAERRYKVRRVNNMVSAFLLLIPFLFILFLLLYYLKSALGINVLPEKHLGDLSDWFFRLLDRVFKLD
ncbi:MAG: hypothetical protein PQJ60_13705 [Spirochaetales bacterium]|nr:hypothetical protein [Spirochaetales bacterium]